MKKMIMASMIAATAMIFMLSSCKKNDTPVTPTTVEKTDSLLVNFSSTSSFRFFSFKNNKLNVSFLNIANKNVYLNVFKDGQFYEGITLGKDIDIQKSFDFSMVEKGNYDVVLRDYFKEHHYNIKK
mgnify:CR=1 FL=1